MKKRIISMMLSLFFTLNLILPQTVVFAAGVYIYNGVYNGNSFAVSYEVQNEWENGKIVRVGITNNSSSIISNWGLKYTETDNIVNIWDGEIYSHNENEYIITNIGYNYAVRPGQTVYFGYVTYGNSGENPKKFEICSKTVEKSQDYDIIFNVASQWTDGFTAEVVINNLNGSAVKAWSVSFDTNCEIVNVWNAEITGKDGERYTISCADSTAVIPANGSVSFGIQAKCTDEVYFKNVKMTEVVIGDASNDSDNDDSGSGSTDDDGDDSGDDSGDSGNDNGGDDNNNDSDEENPNDSDDPSENIDYELDTDSDSLPDYYEEILGTDKNKSDTDGDGLNDGWEVLYLGTDPLKADSDDNGVSDSEEDPDADGLSNLKECEIGTDPNTADTDSDGLNDGDEANTHGTDPLKYDSDDDGISDGDEITLGLNPSSASTDGTPDSEKTFTQTVSADSDVLSAVNEDEETPFDVSLEINAAGVAENNVYARESGYSNAIENSAIIGMAPEFVYTDGLAVEEVTVKFELDESIVNNTLGTYTASSGEFEGIKRLNVFMFFEEINMLLPVETFHDEATNTVYTTTDRMGTYCLMDVEIWLSNLGIEPEIPEVSEALVSEKAELASFTSNSVYTSAKRELAAANTVSKSYRDYFDVAFLIDSRISDDEKFVEIKKSILDVCDMIFNVSPNARVRFIQLMSVERKDVNFYQAITDENGNEFCTDYSAVNDALAKIEQEESGKINILGYEFGTYDSCNVRPGLMEVLASEPMGKYAYCFYILEKEQSLYNTGDVDLAVGENIAPTISVSVISDYIPPSDGEAENYAYIPTLCKNTNGFIASYDETYESCLTEIYGEVPVLENAYKAIIATGYQTVVLDAPITESYETAYKFVEQNPNSSAFYGSYADTDKDGLKDFQEIMYGFHTLDMDGNSIGHTQLIQWDDNGNAILPTFSEVVFSGIDGELFYVEKGYSRYENALGTTAYKELENKIILPISSDPTSEDGDDDDIADKIDGNALISDDFPSMFKNFVIQEIVKYDEIVYISNENMMCAVPLREIYPYIAEDGITYYNLKGDVSDYSYVSEYLDSYYLISCGMGDKAGYFATQWNDNSIIKHIVIINRENKIRKYSKVDFDDLKSDYPTYDLMIKMTEIAQTWLDSVEEIDEFHISNINKFIDASPNIAKIVYKVSGNELFNCLDSTYRNAAKGFFAAAYHVSDAFTKSVATLMMIPKSYIESDYIYRCEFEEKHGYRPFKNTFVSKSLFALETASSTGIYALDDLENNVFLGTDAEREHYLGGVLFELVASLASLEASKILDSASVSIDADDVDDWLEIINKPDSELTPEQLKYKQSYIQSKEADEIAVAINDFDGDPDIDPNSPDVIHDPETGNNYISYKQHHQPPITDPIKELFNKYHQIASPTKKETGKYGEDIAKQMLIENGWEIMAPIKNGSDNGIDIIARSPNGQIGFFEVKSSSTGKINNLSKRQSNVDSFVRDVLVNAKEGKGRYVNIDDSKKQLAAEIWEEVYEKDGCIVSATTIGIDFKNDQIYVSKW